MDGGQRNADYGLGIKHGLGYKTPTKHYGLGIKYGLGYKTRTERYGLGIKHEESYKIPIFPIKGMVFCNLVPRSHSVTGNVRSGKVRQYTIFHWTLKKGSGQCNIRSDWLISRGT